VIADSVLSNLQSNGAFLCRGEDKARLERLIQNSQGRLNTEIVGKSAERIAEMAGITIPPGGARALVAEADGVGREHPLSMEKLSPVLAFYTVADWREGCRRCIEILTFGGLGHTLGLHSNDDEVVRQFALQKPAGRICVNTPAALGAVGYTTNLFPSMTLGCGAFGGNISSDNISPLHLINLKRVAYGVRDVEMVFPPVKPFEQETSMPIDKEKRNNRIEAIIDGWLGQKEPGQPVPEAVPREPRTQTTVSATRPPLDSYNQIEEARESLAEGPSHPVEFVCEDDVRAAELTKNKISIDARTIITPSARDLGNQFDIFIESD